MSEDVRLEVADRIGVITLDRRPVNALSSELYTELADVLDTVGRRQDVSVVVLRSASPRAFCAGADVHELTSLTGAEAATTDERRQVLARQVFDRLLELPQPTIAAIDGPAIGAGAVIASCCDMRMGTPRAAFSLPEIDVGRCGGGRHLMRHLPQGVLRRMYFTAGFLDSVHESGRLLDEVTARARVIAGKSPIALRLGKSALNESEPLPVQDGYALEQQYTLRLARTDDAREALAARTQRRTPNFTAR
jgi:enoyl-CoA hydratase